MNARNLCFIASISLLAACSPETRSKSEPTPPPSALLTTNLAPGQAVFRFNVTGMTCDGCVGGIRSELLRAKGVAAAEVSRKTGQAILIADTNQTSAATLTGVIKEAGFEATIAAP